MNEPLLYKLIGARIKSAREAHRPRMSQDALAGKIGLTRASIVNIEAGRQKAPIHVVWTIAEALRVEPEGLLPKLGELREAEEPIHLDPDAIATIEEAANGDPATRHLLMQFVSRAKGQLKSTNAS